MKNEKEKTYERIIIYVFVVVVDIHSKYKWVGFWNESLLMNVYLDSTQSKAKIKVELKRLFSDYFLIFIQCSFHCIECGLQK